MATDKTLELRTVLFLEEERKKNNWKLLVSEITKVIRTNSLATISMLPKFHSNPISC